jgi:NAD(P)H-flavin reductase
MFQLIKDICKHPDDDIQVRLIFANQTENDILLREELDEFRENYRTKVDVWYTIDKSVESGKLYLLETFLTKLIIYYNIL